MGIVIIFILVVKNFVLNIIEFLPFVKNLDFVLNLNLDLVFYVVNFFCFFFLIHICSDLFTLFFFNQIFIFYKKFINFFYFMVILFYYYYFNYSNIFFFEKYVKREKRLNIINFRKKNKKFLKTKRSYYIKNNYLYPGGKGPEKVIGELLGKNILLLNNKQFDSKVIAFLKSKSKYNKNLDIFMLKKLYLSANNPIGLEAPSQFSDLNLYNTSEDRIVSREINTDYNDIIEHYISELNSLLHSYNVLGIEEIYSINLALDELYILRDNPDNLNDSVIKEKIISMKKDLNFLLKNLEEILHRIEEISEIRLDSLNSNTIEIYLEKLIEFIQTEDLIKNKKILKKFFYEYKDLLKALKSLKFEQKSKVKLEENNNSDENYLLKNLTEDQELQIINLCIKSENLNNINFKSINYNSVNSFNDLLFNVDINELQINIIHFFILSIKNNDIIYYKKLINILNNNIENSNNAFIFNAWFKKLFKFLKEKTDLKLNTEENNSVQLEEINFFVEYLKLVEKSAKKELSYYFNYDEIVRPNDNINNLIELIHPILQSNKGELTEYIKIFTHENYLVFSKGKYCEGIVCRSPEGCEKIQGVLTKSVLENFGEVFLINTNPKKFNKDQAILKIIEIERSIKELNLYKNFFKVISKDFYKNEKMKVFYTLFNNKWPLFINKIINDFWKQQSKLILQICKKTNINEIISEYFDIDCAENLIKELIDQYYIIKINLDFDYLKKLKESKDIVEGDEEFILGKGIKFKKDKQIEFFKKLQSNKNKKENEIEGECVEGCTYTESEILNYYMEKQRNIKLLKIFENFIKICKKWKNDG